MKSFLEWLPADGRNELEEGLGRNLITYGLMGMGAMGAAGCSGGKSASPPAKPASKVEKFSDYIARTKNMHGAERTEEWLKRMSRKQAERNKGTPKELKGDSWTSPEAEKFFK